MKYYLFILLLLCGYSCMKPLMYSASRYNVTDVIDEEAYSLRERYPYFREMVPASRHVMGSQLPNVEPPYYWTEGIDTFRNVKIFEFTQNDTLQEGFYYIKEHKKMFHYVVDFKFKPSHLTVEQLPFDDNHFGLQILRGERLDLLSQNTKYLLTQIRRKSKHRWQVKMWGYCNNQKYE